MKTTEFDYTFLFEPIQNQNTQVTLLTNSPYADFGKLGV